MKLILENGPVNLEVRFTGNRTPEGKNRVKYTITIEDSFHTDTDLLCPPDKGLNHAMGALLSFIGAAIDGIEYQQRTGIHSESARLFPQEITELLSTHSHEIDTMRMEYSNDA